MISAWICRNRCRHSHFSIQNMDTLPCLLSQLPHMSRRPRFRALPSPLNLLLNGTPYTHVCDLR